MNGTTKTKHKTVKLGDLDIFYREAGPKDAPAVLLLHGFPTSSQMFRNLIPALADEYRVVAPDYPGYGHSSMPSREEFAYTFDNLAKVIDEFTEKAGLTRYALYIQDYGAPVGYRLASRRPDRITAIVVQNGNAYDEGLDNDFWKPIKAYWEEPNRQEKRDAIRAYPSRPKIASFSRVKPAYWDRLLGTSSLTRRPGGSTGTGSRTRSWSARTGPPTTSSCSNARGTTRSSSTCSSATAATRRCTRCGRNISGRTNRRC